MARRAQPPPSTHRTHLPAVLARSLLVSALMAGPVACTRHPAAPAGEAVVVRAVDGDTIDVHVGGHPERVRLLGIDTPETVKPDTPVQCWGPEASARAKHLLPPGTRVLLVRDQEARDRYGRLLTYVWRERDRLFVNASLVAGGYARTLSIEPNTARRAQLGALEAEARAHRRGLWGSCPLPP